MTERLGREVTSRLPFRMVDLGAVGVTPDPAEWAAGTDYSHASKAFADVILPSAPYVDQAALATAYTDFDTFIRHSLANGYTAVAFPGFIEFVTLQDAPDGPVYAEGDEHVARALAMRQAFTPFWDRAQELGMKVVLRTDMLTLTTPLEQYLTEHVGSLDTTSPDRRIKWRRLSRSHRTGVGYNGMGSSGQRMGLLHSLRDAIAGFPRIL